MSRYGEAIYERRDVLGVTGPDLAAQSEALSLENPALYAKFSQQTLSRWESDKTGAAIGASSPARLRALAKLLKWTAEEFEEKVGVPVASGRITVSTDNRLRLVGGLVMVPLVGVANGGPPSDYGVPVIPELVRGDNTRAYLVEGNSMAIGEDRGIQDGDWVLVDTSLTKPASGLVFLLEIIGDGMTVKRLKRIQGEWLFMSDNPEADETWRPDQVRIVGHVYGKVDFTEIR
ncbi:MAG: S24 family peptidase [Trueperaceae bacterium]